VTGWSRASFAATAARPSTRALRAPLVLLGTTVVALRLVSRAASDDAVHGLAAGALVLAVVVFLAVGARATLPPLRRSLPRDAVGPAAAIAAVTAALGGGLLGAPVLAALERRYGEVWPALVLLLVAVVVVRRLAGALPALRRAADAADAAEAAAAQAPQAADQPADQPASRRRRRTPAARLLQLRGVDFGYGKLQVLHGVDLDVGDGELVALLGVNGAGKSTVLRAISGLGTPTAGSIRFAGEDITYLDAESRVRRGITQVPGGRAVFGSLTVIDNLRSYGYSLERRAADRAIEGAFAAFPRLAERRHQHAGTLSGGEQQMLAMAKAMMLRPRLLLIDELSLGLAPIIVAQLLDSVRAINATGTAVVLVEQSVNIALELAEHAFFMERGAVQFDGRSRDLLARDDLLRAVFLDGASGR
jgi:ABC-type branched-subunit amino acid transport system ATPase component